jgi:hypothetical protein
MRHVGMFKACAWSVCALFPAAAASGMVEYAYDDGVANVNIGPPSSFEEFDRTDMIWGNAFTAIPGGEQITELSLQIGSLVGGSAELELLVYDDPTGNPASITGAPLASITTTVVDPGFGQFVDIPLASPVTVSGDFFIAAALRMADPGDDAPGALDPDAAAFGGNAWLMYSPAFDSSDLSGSIAFATAMNDSQFVPIFGAWAFHATGVPSPGSMALAGLAGLVVLRRGGR